MHRCAEDVPGPIIELHISNIHRREPIYHRSQVSPVATAVIAGLGPKGYAIAVTSMKMLLAASERRRASGRPRAPPLIMLG